MVDDYKGDTGPIIDAEVEKGREARGRLRAKKVNVGDVDETIMAGKIDKEWNTTGWDDTMVGDTKEAILLFL